MTNELLYIRCPIGILQERRASTMFPLKMKPLATAVQWFRTELWARTVIAVQCPQFSVFILIIVFAVGVGLRGEDVIFIIISRPGTSLLFCTVSCRSIEATTADTTMQHKIAHPPPQPINLNEANCAQNAARSHVDSADSNPNAPLNEKHETIAKANCKSVNGIISSPDNPATVRRLSQEDSSNTVSWHKRVVVHRVPRSDASRSMFVSSSQSKEGLSSQCCVIV